MPNDGPDGFKDLDKPPPEVKPAKDDKDEVDYHAALRLKMKEAKEAFMKPKPKVEQLYYLYKLALNRRNLTHSMAQSCTYFIRNCICCPARRCDKMMNKGIHRLESSLDMMKLLRTLQEI